MLCIFILDRIALFKQTMIQQDWPVQAYSAFCALGGRREPAEKDKSPGAEVNLWLGVRLGGNSKGEPAPPRPHVYIPFLAWDQLMRIISD